MLTELASWIVKWAHNLQNYQMSHQLQTIQKNAGLRHFALASYTNSDYNHSLHCLSMAALSNNHSKIVAIE